MNQNDKDILEIVKEMPGLTRSEVVELMPHVNKYTVFKRLQVLSNNGKLKIKTKPHPTKGRSLYTYIINPSPAPNVFPIADQELKARIATLEAWKAAAIERYPDLAVDPEIIQARQIVAKHFTNGERELILRGGWDTKPIMQVTLEALAA